LVKWEISRQNIKFSVFAEKDCVNVVLVVATAAIVEPLWISAWKIRVISKSSVSTALTRIASKYLEWTTFTELCKGIQERGRRTDSEQIESFISTWLPDKVTVDEIG